MARSFTVPGLLDSKGRSTARARVRVRRTDTHVWLDEVQYTDEYGQCTFTTLPEGVGCVFLAQWGTNSRWFDSRILSVSEGGTGSGDPDDAIDNLEIDKAAIMYAIVF